MRNGNAYMARIKAWLDGADYSFFVPVGFFCFAIIVGIVLIDGDRKQQYVAAERLETARLVENSAARLQAQIATNTSLVQGLGAVISANPASSQSAFEPLAKSIYAQTSQLKVIAAAPDLVISAIYPFEPNRKAIGLRYLDNPQQRTGVLRARDTGKMVLTGPIDLVQGGTGLIARYPVFLQQDGRFWGIVSAVIDLPKLYSDSGFADPNGPLRIALYRHGADHQHTVFFGEPRLLEQDPVSLAMNVGIETWYIAAVPREGWGGYRKDLLQFRFYTTLVAIMVFLPLVWAALMTKQRQANLRRLGEREEQLETLSHRLGLAIRASGIGVWEYIPHNNTLIWDQRMRDLYGVDPQKVVCDFEDWRSALHPDDREEAEQVFLRCMEREIPYVTEFRVTDWQHNIRHIRAHGTVYRNSAGEKRIVGVNWDITRDVNLNRALREARDQLEHQSLHDALTGLPNRRYLERFLNSVASHPVMQKIGLIHADLDRFKEVNDTFGHTAGDQVLVEAARRIRERLQSGEIASRIGGDEFVIVTSGAQAEERARVLAQEIVNSLGEPLVLENGTFRVGCSAGIAVQGYRQEDPMQLLGNADIALYESKKRGRNRVEFFSEGLRAAAVETRKTSDELLVALERDAFIPYFQPQFDAVTYEITGAEALARWNHESRGILTPDKFLAVAEATNRMADIDMVIFEKALFNLALWQAKGLPIPSVSVNISAQRLGDERLFDSLSRLSIKPGTVSFELLETIYLDGQDQTLINAARRLKEAGIEIEIDDFGSGHASIISLLELAPKRLKIDRKLIAPLSESPVRRQLVASIIEIGRSQGIEIVAEGVETMEHATILRDLGCHILQGYAFARPMPASEMTRFLAEWRTQREALLAVG